MTQHQPAHSGLEWTYIRAVAALGLALSLLTGLLPLSTMSGARVDEPTINVIVRETFPATEDAERTVEELGGVVRETLSVIGGFTASVPTSKIPTLRAAQSVIAATEDATVESLKAGWQDASNLGDYTPSDYDGSMLNTGKAVAVDGYWSQGVTGQGVGVAVIDTGVARVEGLALAGKVIDGVDLSFDRQVSGTAGVDANGHGTHVAGIIAGRDATAPETLTVNDGKSHYLGVAPDAHIVNVKVGSFDGAVDVSQVIAAIDWVIQHKDDPGMNIRVLNLSYGTDSTQDPLLDPLSYAVEQAWHQGIVVVVASGNDGNHSPVRNPGSNPYVITVGAADNLRNKGRSARPIPSWSACGVDRTVDLVAPGASIVGLRVPGSKADSAHPNARVADRFFLGSGTSQAAAVASGAAALVLAANPHYTPDQVKEVLTRGATPFKFVSSNCQGSGQIDLDDSWGVYPYQSQSHTLSSGMGSLEESRGSFHLEIDGVVLAGEYDIMGNLWDAETWTQLIGSAASWDGDTWNDANWSGGSWSGGSWSGGSWSGGSWSGGSWSGGSWSGGTWSGGTWSGGTWSGGTWSGGTWSGSIWQ